jgi:hypothetical protein
MLRALAVIKQNPLPESDVSFCFCRDQKQNENQDDPFKVWTYYDIDSKKVPLIKDGKDIKTYSRR